MKRATVDSVRDYTLEQPKGHMRRGRWISGYGEWLRDTTRNARVYVDLPEENILDNLQNRHSRPHKVWAPVVRDCLIANGFTFTTLRWSQTAGCRCGCSPGFIAGGIKGKDIWVKFVD